MFVLPPLHSLVSRKQMVTKAIEVRLCGISAKVQCATDLALMVHVQ
jgi:hypothetical protein